MPESDSVIVEQLHLTTWPDHGVPSSTSNLLGTQTLHSEQLFIKCCARAMTLKYLAFLVARLRRSRRQRDHSARWEWPESNIIGLYIGIDISEDIARKLFFIKVYISFQRILVIDFLSFDSCINQTYPCSLLTIHLQRNLVPLDCPCKVSQLRSKPRASVKNNSCL